MSEEQEQQDPVELEPGFQGGREPFVQHVHPDMGIGLYAVAQGQQDAGGVEVPLDLLKLDPAFAECITQHHVQHDDGQQQHPEPGGPAPDPVDQRINDF